MVLNREMAARGVMVLALVMALSGCGRGEPSWRNYEEVTEPAPSSRRPVAGSGDSMPAARAAKPTWTAPEGWTEEAGSGMRLGSFSITRDGSTGSCSIITLGGAAGGLEANVRRWFGQLEIPVPEGDELRAFLESQEKFVSEGGLEGVLVDLTSWGGSEPEEPSMMATLLKLEGATLFIKFTGPRGLLAGEKEPFRQLSRSVKAGG